MAKDKKRDFQQKFDIQKWTESEQAGYDKCGEYEFCGQCDKNLTDPCAEAHFLNEGMTLKESIAIAAAQKSNEEIGKKFVADYLVKTYGDKVEVNRRANKISTGRLPLADTHYVVGEKKACFIYVYETDEGGVMFLIKAPKEYAENLQKSHEKVFKSAFPKAKNSWYTVIVDETYAAADVEKMLDELVKING